MTTRNNKGQFVKGSKPIAGFQKGHLKGKMPKNFELFISKRHNFEKGHKMRLGVKHSEETKKKISKKLKGKRASINTEFKKGNISFYKNNLMSDETKKNISLSKKGKKLSLELRERLSKIHKELGHKPPIIRGKNHYNWKGGVSSEREIAHASIDYKLWRLEVFSRDNHTCQKCGIRGGILRPHHIENFSEKIAVRFISGNGITFCEKCHKEFHHIYGKKNNTLKQLEEFLEKGFKFYHYDNIYGNAKIGINTKIGSFVEICNDVVIGKNCKIQTMVSIPPLTVIEDDVFLGPGVKIMNDKHLDGNLKGLIIGKGAKIGIGAIICANIGNYAVVGAGAVVINEVVDGTTVVGNPAKVI